MKIISGFAVHQHHINLIEWCPDFDARVKEIKENKPANKQEIRLRLFKMLSKEAIAALPESVKDSAIKYSKARDKYWKAEDVYSKAKNEYFKARDEYSKARDEYWEARDEWTDKESWHEKYCGCKEWNGKKIVFN